MILQGVHGDEGYLRDLTTSLVSPTTVEAAIGFHQNGEMRVGSIVRESLWMPLLSSVLWAESLSPLGTRDFQ